MQGKKFLAAHNHPDPTEYYAPLAKSLSNTQTQDPVESSFPSPSDAVGEDAGNASSPAAVRLRSSGGALSGADLILDPLPDLKSRPARSSFSEHDMETSPDLSLSPNSDYSTGESSSLASCLSLLCPLLLGR